MAKDRFGHGTEEKSYIDRFDKEEYEVEENSIDLQEWSKQPWNNEKDIPIMRQALISIFKGYHRDKKPFLVPASSWGEKRDAILQGIFKAAQQKEGFPKDMTLRDYGITDKMQEDLT